MLEPGATVGFVLAVVGVTCDDVAGATFVVVVVVGTTWVVAGVIFVVVLELGTVLDVVLELGTVFDVVLGLGTVVELGLAIGVFDVLGVSLVGPFNSEKRKSVHDVKNNTGKADAIKTLINFFFI